MKQLTSVHFFHVQVFPDELYPVLVIVHTLLLVPLVFFPLKQKSDSTMKH